MRPMRPKPLIPTLVTIVKAFEVNGRRMLGVVFSLERKLSVLGEEEQEGRERNEGGKRGDCIYGRGRAKR